MLDLSIHSGPASVLCRPWCFRQGCVQQGKENGRKQGKLTKSTTLMDLYNMQRFETSIIETKLQKEMKYVDLVDEIEENRFI